MGLGRRLPSFGVSFLLSAALVAQATTDPPRTTAPVPGFPPAPAAPLTPGGALPACPPALIHGAIGGPSPDYPAVHGSQTDRLFRSGMTSTCAAPGTCATFGDTNARAFDAYTFFNSSGATSCVTVTVGTDTCAGTNFVFPAAYLDSFDPANLCTSYLADPGSSPTPGGPVTFSFDVPAGKKFVVVVAEVTPAGGCSSYTISVKGPGVCLPVKVDQASTGTTTGNGNGVFEPGERVVVDPSWHNDGFLESFDGVTAPAIPSDWTATLATGLGGDPAWATSTTSPDSSPNSVFAPDPNHVTDNLLISPLIGIGSSGATLTFRNFYVTESTFDGGVLEISSPNINAGAFTDITDPAVGGSFASGGYNGTISNGFSSPIKGRQAWTGNAGGYIDTIADLGPHVAGQTIQLRWRMASDLSVSSTGWRIDSVTLSGANSQDFTASMNGLSGPVGAAYGTDDPNADYGILPAGGAADAFGATGNAYEAEVSNPATRPAFHWDSLITETRSNGATRTYNLHIGNSFTDVSTGSGFYKFIETIFHNGVTTGCGGTNYCPTASTSRAQVAVFTLVSKEGPSFSPPACSTPMFGDVPASSPFCKWIEELARRGVVSGCGGGNYCPGDPVSRAQMAVFTLATLEGSSFSPPACGTPMFGDVPASSPFCKWIEELARRGVVAGCGGGNYCPTAPVTRAQMSVFLTQTFGLLLYGQ